MTRPRPTDPESFLPLKPIAFHVLLSLGDGERHGYAITQEISARTSARVRIEPGNLYRTIKALLDDGLIEQGGETAGGDERRRYYRITRLGRLTAAAETGRLEALVADAKGREWLKERG